MTVFEFDAKTHSGRVRGHNEDQIYCSAKDHLWIVADGMGGHACGEIASEIVVRELSNFYSEGKSLETAIELAHAAVTREAELNTSAHGMGATVVVMSALLDQYSIAWVGDSRAYRLRNKKLELLTRDHSYLEWLKENGITVEEARKHPKRNVITQSIGVGEPNPDTVTGFLEPGDRYLLCSDGLNDELTDEEILEILDTSDNSALVTQALIDAALEKGGRDNVSVILVDIDPNKRKQFFLSKSSFSLKETRQMFLPLFCGVVAALILVAVLKILK